MFLQAWYICWAVCSHPGSHQDVFQWRLWDGESFCTHPANTTSPFFWSGEWKVGYELPLQYWQETMSYSRIRVLTNVCVIKISWLISHFINHLLKLKSQKGVVLIYLLASYWFPSDDIHYNSQYIILFSTRSILPLTRSFRWSISVGRWRTVFLYKDLHWHIIYQTSWMVAINGHTFALMTSIHFICVVPQQRSVSRLWSCWRVSHRRTLVYTQTSWLKLNSGFTSAN